MSRGQPLAATQTRRCTCDFDDDRPQTMKQARHIQPPELPNPRAHNSVRLQVFEVEKHTLPHRTKHYILSSATIGWFGFFVADHLRQITRYRGGRDFVLGLFCQRKFRGGKTSPPLGIPKAPTTSRNLMHKPMLCSEWKELQITKSSISSHHLKEADFQTLAQKGKRVNTKSGGAGRKRSKWRNMDANSHRCGGLALPTPGQGPLTTGCLTTGGYPNQRLPAVSQALVCFYNTNAAQSRR